jgi:hypothetical protein
MEAWQLEPGLITARWRVSFVAPLPPTLKLLELPEDVPKIPGAAVQVETTMRFGFNKIQRFKHQNQRFKRFNHVPYWNGFWLILC